MNSLWVDDFSKIAQVSAFLSVHNFDIFCICESFLNSSIQDDDPRLAIDGYELIRSDHPSNSKRGGVCIYFKSHLPLVRKPELTSLDECITCKLKIGSSNLLLCLTYRSPSQDFDQFESFKSKWEETINNFQDLSPTCSVFLGDFNARNSNWWLGDITNSKGREISEIANQHDLYQLIDKPTHILPGSSSCIDLIFTSSDTLIAESGILPSLHPSCHHQIVYAKFNFKIPLPPAYKRRIWDFSRADSALINRAMGEIDWVRAFEGLDLDQRVSFLTDCVNNTFLNLVPNKVITVRPKDALWMTPEIKRLLAEKAKIYKRYVKHGRNALDYQHLCNFSRRCKDAIDNAKQNYYTKLGNDLNNPDIGSKKYWSILNRFLNKRKIPKIPPVQNDRNILVTDVSEKANVFNSFFANQCSLINTDSILPPDVFFTDHRLELVNFDESKLLSFIRALNVNKAHGCDEISIRMIKLCDESLVKPLINIFSFSLFSGKFPNDWKRANIVPVYKKGDKSIVKNYRPVSLLPIFSKLFEKCIYDTLYGYFDSKGLFSVCQSGFRKGDSCIFQLLSITHDIFKGFDANLPLDTRGVFLDISKAFDRVWHEGLLFKLRSYGVSGNLLALLRDFLSGRVQRVVLNGKTSLWELIKAGVPQGSILGPLLFLIFINDLPANLLSNCKIFADDTSLFSLVNDQMQSTNILNRDLQKINDWAYQWKMSFNPDPTKQAVEVCFSKKRAAANHPVISFNGSEITVSEAKKHLGLTLDSKLTFGHHLEEKILKANKGIGLINRLRKFLPRESLLTVYKTFVRPHLDYGDVIYDWPGNATFVQKLESVQYSSCLAITGCFRGTSREKLYSELGLESLADRRLSRRLLLFYKIINGFVPAYLSEYLPPQNIALRNVRRPLIFTVRGRTERYLNSFFPYCMSRWNSLDSRIRNLPSISKFKSAILEFLRPNANSTFKIGNDFGVTLLTRLRVGFSHLREHKFRHGFLDTVDPFCSCSTNSIETTEHFLLHCSNYSNDRNILFNSLKNLSVSLIPLKPSFLCDILLFGDSNFSNITNRGILSLVINYIHSTERFIGPLF